MKSSTAFPLLQSSRFLPASELAAVYQKLREHFGPQHWWPADSPFEMIVGAVLTQNTSWTQVEKAIQNLKRESLLSFSAMRNLQMDELAQRIRPAGYFNLKAKRLKAFILFVEDRFAGDLPRFLSLPQTQLRESLLSIYGVGPETADSIVLYAAGYPSFVIDAYTRRIFTRHALSEQNGKLGQIRKKLERWTYEDWRHFFMKHLPEDTPLFNDYHAQIVRLAKTHCRSRAPLCETCPLKSYLN